MHTLGNLCLKIIVQGVLKHEIFYLQIGSSIACGTGVNLSKFYYYEPESDTCLAEIGCPVPLDDTSRGNRCVIEKNFFF